MPTVLITGGTGLLGTALSRQLLSKGYSVIIMSRKPPRQETIPKGIQYAKWDVQEQTIDRDCIEKADFIVHLAGAGIADKRWSGKRKKAIVDSRVQGTELIIRALREIPNRVQAIVSASAIGWYGPDQPVSAGGSVKSFVETNPPFTDFLGTTCRVWEESLKPAVTLGKRVVRLRTGIVLSRKGGALPSFLRPIRLGIAAILGSGKQAISWIHIDDLCRLYQQAIENPAMKGAYNAVAPHPVSNKAFTIALAKEFKGRFFLPIYIPSFLLKIFLGEMSIEVLKSATVSCEKIKQTGFIFQFPEIEAAAHQLHHD